ncbi:ATP-binding cassette domain-containing protein [Streptomyces sp. MCAF7]
MLELHDITAGYARHAPVVRDASLTVEPGEAVGLLGPSGCGKSTLARVAALLHRPDSGTLLLDGTLCRSKSHRCMSCRVSVLVDEAAEDPGAQDFAGAEAMRRLFVDVGW